MFHTYVSSVLSGCRTCFYNDFQMFSDVFANVLDACFKCFICLQTYIANVSSGYFKSKSDVAAGDPPVAVGIRAGEVEGAHDLRVGSGGAGDVQTGMSPHVGAQNGVQRAGIRMHVSVRTSGR